MNVEQDPAPCRYLVATTSRWVNDSPRRALCSRAARCHPRLLV